MEEFKLHNLPVIATHAVIDEGSETPGLSKYVRLNSIPGCKPQSQRHGKGK
jgi:hypothetical protein